MTTSTRPPAPATRSAPALQAAAPPAGLWHLQLLGGLQLTGAGVTLSRLPSRAVAALLARLAMWPARQHGREELIELLWPGVDLPTGRNRLRQALSTLKSQLEPPGHPPVLRADRLTVQARPGALSCDVPQFEAALRTGQLAQATALYRGELLPGYFDEWIVDERQRLAALADRLPELLPGAPALSAAATPAGSPPQDEAGTATPGAGDSPASPAWPAVAMPRIPVYATRYFGFDQQAGRLRRLVLAQRLVTVLGPGGSGKTRLAVELSQALRGTPVLGADLALEPGFDLVVFVPLASCTTRAAMDDALCAALHLAPHGSPLIERLAQTLAGRRVLLVLDNLEQMLPVAADAIGQWLDALPELHVLATSRRVLGRADEHEFVVAALPSPKPDAPLDVAAAAPAVALFVDRARAVRADFHLGARNTAGVVELVRTLGGWPLAIELAASRVRSSSPQEMLQRLRAAADGAAPGAASGLKLLERGRARGDAASRHASMEQVIDWSWQQLDDAQRQVLSALTVLPAGCSAGAAAAVSARDDAADRLDELVQHSLVAVQVQRDDRVRFGVAEPIREFALGRLDRPQWLQLRARLRAWCQRWAGGLGTTPSLVAVNLEMPNLLAALSSAVEDGAADEAVRLALALRPALNEVPLLPSGQERLRQALAGCTDASLRGPGYTLLGVLGYDGGRRTQALQDAERGLAETPEEGVERARALHSLASLRWQATRSADGLDELLDESLRLAERLGHLGIQASVHALRGFIIGARRDGGAQAEAMQRRALQLWEQLGNRHAINGGQYNLAVRACNRQGWQECLDRLDTVCRIAREDEDWSQLSQALNVRGNALAARRDWPAALAAYQEAAELAWSIGNGIDLYYALWNVPATLVRLRQPEHAARLSAHAVHHWQTHYGELGEQDRRELRRFERLLAVLLPPARRQQLADEGRALTPLSAMQVLRGSRARPAD